jgi:nucleotidyltransferase/DNA polymerase involved in DNA repair
MATLYQNMFRQWRCSERLLVLGSNGQSLINQNSEQQTPKFAFIVEMRRIARRSPPAVVYGEMNAVSTAEYAARDEVQQTVTALESHVKFRCLFLVASQD